MSEPAPRKTRKTRKTPETRKPRKKAGVFDIRYVIAGLIGAYGVILVLLGLFNASEDELARGDGININLWAGLGMLVAAAVFAVWARLRPVVVPVEED